MLLTTVIFSIQIFIVCFVNCIDFRHNYVYNIIELL